MSGDATTERRERFECFGSNCETLVTGSGPMGSPGAATAMARRRLLAWHECFSRFRADSELSRLNRDPRELVPVSPMMARFAGAVITAGSMSGGLVDATLTEQIELAGYVGDLPTGVALDEALELAPERKPAAAARAPGWRRLDVDPTGSSVRRPPALMLDSGGIAKGLFADVLAESLAGHAGFAINCAGDIAIGGARGLARPVKVQSPFDGEIIHTFELERAGIATSGIGRRSWLDPQGRPAHHLLDPSTGEPAFTGIVQVTAIAPHALTAEVRAKAALLSGPRRAGRWLPDGGVIVFDDGSHQVIDPPSVVTLGQLSGFHQRPRRRALQGS